MFLRRTDSGKHKFLNRLSTELRHIGIKIVDNDADVLLHIGRKISKLRAKKIIMRVDGLILNKAQSYEKKNKKILRYIGKSDAIIYQGVFCKKAYEKFLKVKKYNTCLHNGADPREFLKRDVHNYFFSYCRWRPHKRLNNICDGFIRALENGLDSFLYIAGDIDKNERINHPNIKYLGWISQDKIKKHLSHAIATIHLSWLDWCPNAMVESLVAGCPVLYSDSGGSGEIGRLGGIAIKDVQWDFSPVFLYKPPILDVDAIAKALLSMNDNPIYPKAPGLDIGYIARNYLDFFYKVLEI
ncbi:MAG: glycosyltransferase [Candidatus Asgardarchaeia archaeon]